MTQTCSLPACCCSNVATTQQEARLAARYLIDGLTPDECLALYQRVQREEETPAAMTRAQWRIARALWSHDVRVAVKDARRPR